MNLKRLLAAALAAAALSGAWPALAQPIPGPSGASSLVQQTEDAAHSTGAKGDLALCVRKDTAASTAGSDGDYAGIICDANGNAWVRIGAALPAGTNNIGDVDVLTLPALSAGSNNIGDIDVLTAPGTFAEDAAHSSGNVGSFGLCVRKDTAASTAGTDGDYAGVICDANGKTWVNLTELATLIGAQGATAWISGDGTVISLLKALVGAANDTTPVNTNGVTSSGARGSIVQADGSVPIAMTTATTTQLVALTSGQKIYIMAWDATAAGTTNFKLVTGTGTNCGTGQSDLTGNYNWIAQAGIAKGSGLGPVIVVPTGQAVCATNSAGVTVSGSLAYTKQ